MGTAGTLGLLTIGIDTQGHRSQPILVDTMAGQQSPFEDYQSG